MAFSGKRLSRGYVQVGLSVIAEQLFSLGPILDYNNRLMVQVEHNPEAKQFTIDIIGI